MGGVGLGNGDFRAGESITINKMDTDGDGLSDGAEVLQHGTNPLDIDTDSDGFTDRVEVLLGRDPLSVPSAPLSVWLLFGLMVPLGVLVVRRKFAGRGE